MLDNNRPVLITGAAGQDGLLLARLLSKDGLKVFGLVRNSTQGERMQSFCPDATPVIGDITDSTRLRGILSEHSPGAIVNLAASSSVATSWTSASATMMTNTTAVASLLDLVREHHTGGDPITFYQASSSEMFGSLNGDLVDEIFPLKPTSPYAISKVAAHELAQSFRSAFGLDVRIGILFNHESPLRQSHFLTRKISSAVARIALGKQQQLELGDLTIRRDWGYAGDFAQAIRLMLEMPEPDDFIVATGETHSVADLVSFAFKHIGISDWERYVISSTEHFRPIEHPPTRGDSSKIRQKLGWFPTKSIEDTISEMVDFDLMLLKNEIAKNEWQPND